MKLISYCNLQTFINVYFTSCYKLITCNFYRDAHSLIILPKNNLWCPVKNSLVYKRECILGSGAWAACWSFFKRPWASCFNATHLFICHVDKMLKLSRIFFFNWSSWTWVLSFCLFNWKICLEGFNTSQLLLL